MSANLNRTGIPELERENAQLRASLTVAQEERERETKFACEMRTEREGWRNTAETATARVMELSSELEKLKTENDNVHAVALKHAIDCGNLTVSLSAAQNENTALTEKCRKYVVDLAAKQVLIDEARKDEEKTRKIMQYLTCYGDSNMVDWANEWIASHRLSAHPEVEK